MDPYPVIELPAPPEELNLGAIGLRTWKVHAPGLPVEKDGRYMFTHDKLADDVKGSFFKVIVNVGGEVIFVLATPP